MDLHVAERSDGIGQVALVGKLDLSGLHAIDMKFHAQTAAQQRDTIVDLTGLEFIASLGMGLLISCGQSLQRRGKRMVLVGATGVVDVALRTAGLDNAMPMVASVDEAVALLTA